MRDPRGCWTDRERGREKGGRDILNGNLVNLIDSDMINRRVGGRRMRWGSKGGRVVVFGATKRTF